MYYKRLEQGRFYPRIFLRQGIGFRSMRWDELVLLMEGISPKVARRHRYVIEERRKTTGRLHHDHLLKKEHKYFCNKE